MSNDLPKMIGYWHWDYEPGSGLPHPQDFVTPGFYGAELPLVLAYLRSGQSVLEMLGYSFCRFRCGVANSDMGGCDFGDGEWIWPEGLAHYVEAHSVRLPAEFLETMRRNNWRPDVVPITPISVGEYGDISYWIAWAEAQKAL